MHSPVLQDIHPESAGAAQALNMLNDLNRSFFFVKFTFRDGILIARYDLLGETLQAGELVNALYEIAGAADRLDDELAGLLGGMPYEASSRSGAASEPSDQLIRQSETRKRAPARGPRRAARRPSGGSARARRVDRPHGERHDV